MKKIIYFACMLSMSSPIVAGPSAEAVKLFWTIVGLVYEPADEDQVFSGDSATCKDISTGAFFFEYSLKVRQHEMAYLLVDADNNGLWDRKYEATVITPPLSKWVKGHWRTALWAVSLPADKTGLQSWSIAVGTPPINLNAVKIVVDGCVVVIHEDRF